MMPVLYTIVAVVFVWWLIKPLPAEMRENLSREIDPADADTVGRLVGMMGGSITDAALTRYALERFEETHGRKATWQDLGIVAGLVKSMH